MRSDMNAENKIMKYNQQVMDNVFKPLPPIPLKTRRREPEYQWDTTFAGMPVTVDIYCRYQNGDRGDVYNPPQGEGMVVEFIRIDEDTLYSPRLLDACQQYVDECNT